MRGRFHSKIIGISLLLLLGASTAGANSLITVGYVTGHGSGFCVEVGGGFPPVAYSLSKGCGTDVTGVHDQLCTIVTIADCDDDGAALLDNIAARGELAEGRTPTLLA